MKELYKEIYKKIKEYDKIVIARHIGADPDALGSTMGLKELILNTFPEKKVSVIGVYSSVFKYMGRMDKLNENEIKDSLLIVCDTPNVERIDGVTNPRDYAYVIKIDHHPAIEKFEDLKWVDTSASSVCQMLIELTYETRLKMNKEAAEKLFMGLVSDTNRFLYDYTSPKTFMLVSKLIQDTKIDITSLYNNLYSRPLIDVRFMGYVAQTMTVTEGGLGYLIIPDEIVQRFGGDAALAGNVIGSFNNINEVLVWVIFTEDRKNELIKVNARSRGPEIHTVLEKYGGGGHPMASGARLKNKDDVEKIINDLEELCKNYRK
ncbi:MAG: bifunctional oligoribonuclease/PAP phosphatase NrnA [Bacilli bacterium]|nr:bifunctional oligoribonuclease/PAP phosphatase NrnA [Bacilli bacterium]